MVDDCSLCEPKVIVSNQKEEYISIHMSSQNDYTILFGNYNL